MASVTYGKSIMASVIMAKVFWQMKLSRFWALFESLVWVTIGTEVVVVITTPEETKPHLYQGKGSLLVQAMSEEIKLQKIYFQHMLIFLKGYLLNFSEVFFFTEISFNCFFSSLKTNMESSDCLSFSSKRWFIVLACLETCSAKMAIASPMIRNFASNTAKVFSVLVVAYSKVVIFFMRLWKSLSLSLTAAIVSFPSKEFFFELQISPSFKWVTQFWLLSISIILFSNWEHFLMIIFSFEHNFL